ncbi:two-component system sensor kinase FixL [Paraburkholderia sp. HC6.4b]|uniref:PAS domain-containing sensor histidine kinase n=1 Tax=unclassified Paraburkholderia TaxID=2615204 RepID=UPI0016212E25|nr:MULTISPECIES: PAS domain-containing sensor histidine kinase [unclassified Paraburkholderia]MBB5410215.1 two-component system sensor kinase FixL [Paraburkholderia sp. HC6.4b]MBB5452424.1 two-component system sensor kinase FixL [Paraburkholderia sp. Kb1A]
MINLIVYGRHLAIGVAGILTALHAQPRHMGQCGPSQIDNARNDGPPLSGHDRSRQFSPRHHRFQHARNIPGVSSRQSTRDTHEPPYALPAWRRCVAACASWLRGEGDSSTRRILDASMPLCETLEMLPVPIVTVDQRDQIIFANARAAQLFGYTREELIGAPTAKLFPIDGINADRSGPGNRGAKIQIPGVTTTQILIARRRDGGGFHAEAETTRCRVHNQDLRITAISDCSACGEVDGNTRDLAHLARVSSLGELAGSLAHELKQPLTAILFNAQAARKFMDAETTNVVELREALEDIVADNCRANEVLQRIRALVRKGDVELQLLDVGNVVRDIATLVHSDALTRSVRTSFDIPNNLALICGDKVQLQQVILNLLLNAFDAVKDCPAADRLVETTAREEADGLIRITVKDRGQGLDVDSMERIFRPFFTTKPQGLGLGLSISRTIVTAHRGRLWAENNEGKGASFHVTLPVATDIRQRLVPRSS